jgi:hypothetical protein
MTGDVPGQLAIVSVPAALPLGLGLEPGGRAEESHHPVRLEGQEIGGVAVLGLFQGAACQADIAERQGPGLRRDRGLRRARGGPEGTRGQEGRNDGQAGAERSVHDHLADLKRIIRSAL